MSTSEEGKNVAILKRITSLNDKPRQLRLARETCGGMSVSYAVSMLRSSRWFNGELIVDVWHHPTELISPGFLSLVKEGRLGRKSLRTRLSRKEILFPECCGSCREAAERRARRIIKGKTQMRPCRYVLVIPRKLMLSVLTNLLFPDAKGLVVVTKIIIDFL